MNSEDVSEIMKAIKNVQQNAPYIEKNSTGQVGTRQYGYANLVDTWDPIKDLLNKNNLVVIQSPTSGVHGGNYFKTTIYHTESNQHITETMQMVLQREDPQAIGAAITYYRRYMLLSMLGLVPDDDNDARDHRLATAEQKRLLVGAIRLVYPDIQNEKIVKAIEDLTGKHPSRIREDEVDDFVGLIKAFGN